MASNSESVMLEEIADLKARLTKLTVDHANVVMERDIIYKELRQYNLKAMQDYANRREASLAFYEAEYAKSHPEWKKGAVEFSEEELATFDYID